MHIYRWILPTWQYLHKDLFLRNLFLLSGGHVLGRLMIVAVYPFLTRLYSPESMGGYAAMLGVLAVVTEVVGLKYDVAVMGGEDTQEIRSLVYFFCMHILGFTALFFLLYFLFPNLLHGFDCLTVFLCVGFVWISSIYTLGRYVVLRAARTAVLSASSLCQGGGKALAQVIFGTAHMGTSGLLWGEIIGKILGCLYMIRDVFSLSFSKNSKGLCRYGVLFRKHHKYVLYTLPSSVLNTFSAQCIFLLLAAFYGTKEAGYFFLAQKIISLPTILFGGSIADAFHERIATFERSEPENIRPLFTRMTWIMGLASLFLFSGLCLTAVWIIPLLFGAQWGEASALFPALVPWAAIQFCVSPLSRVVLVLRSQEYKFIYDVLSIVFSFLSVYVGYSLHFSLADVVMFWGFLQFLSYGIYYVILYFLVHASEGVLQARTGGGAFLKNREEGNSDSCAG